MASVDIVDVLWYIVHKYLVSEKRQNMNKNVLKNCKFMQY